MYAVLRSYAGFLLHYSKTPHYDTIILERRLPFPLL